MTDSPPPPVANGIRIARLAGIGVYVSPSWFLVAGLMVFMLSQNQAVAAAGASPLLVSLALVVCFSLSLLAHELAHALLGRARGREVRSITLHFFGGATQFADQARNPLTAFLVSVVGPLTTLAIAGLCWLVATLSTGAVGLGAQWLAWLNLILGVFNLLPGLPLDGGHALAAGVWRVTGDRGRGTLLAAHVGQVIAVLVLLWPLVAAHLLGWQTGTVDYLIGAMMALFLWQGARASAYAATIQRRLPDLSARALGRSVLVVPGDLPVAEAVRRAQEAGVGALATHTSDDRIDGIVNETAVAALPSERRPWVPVSTVTTTLLDGHALPAEIGGQDLIDALLQTPAEEYLLIEGDGTLYGVLARADVERALR